MLQGRHPLLAVLLGATVQDALVVVVVAASAEVLVSDLEAVVAL